MILKTFVWSTETDDNEKYFLLHFVFARQTKLLKFVTSDWNICINLSSFLNCSMKKERKKNSNNVITVSAFLWKLETTKNLS